MRKVDSKEVRVEVINMLVSGMSSKEVAESLGLSSAAKLLKTMREQNLIPDIKYQTRSTILHAMHDWPVDKVKEFINATGTDNVPFTLSTADGVIELYRLNKEAQEKKKEEKARKAEARKKSGGKVALAPEMSEAEAEMRLKKFINDWNKKIRPLSNISKMGLIECYRNVYHRGLDADEWFKDAFSIMIRKMGTRSLRTGPDGNYVGYFVTMIRNWLVSGRGFSNSWQDRIITAKMAERFGNLDHIQSRELFRVMGEFGTLAIYVTLDENPRQRDFTQFIEVDVPSYVSKISRS